MSQPLRADEGEGQSALAPRAVASLAAAVESPLGPEQRAYLQLLAKLRTLVDKTPVPTVVIAAASEGEAVSRLAKGLESAAARCGMRLLIAELDGSPARPILRPKGAVMVEAAGRPAERHRDWPHERFHERPFERSRGGGADGGGAAAGGDVVAMGANGGRGANGAGGASPEEAKLELRGGGGALPSLFERWSERAGAGGVDLVLIETPPLDQSFAATLLAKACDGLVIAVESAVTSAESLQSAVDLAQAAGCNVLGLVISGARPALPSWMRRLLAATRLRPRPARS